MQEHLFQMSIVTYSASSGAFSGETPRTEEGVHSLAHLQDLLSSRPSWLICHIVSVTAVAVCPVLNGKGQCHGL